jgi:CRISPR/Cas system-associated exonuclease Cas4 (RecB family)
MRTFRQSQIEDLLDCPERFRRSYLTDDQGGTSASALMGTAVHVALAEAQGELIDNGVMLAPWEVGILAEGYFETGVFFDTQGEDPIAWRFGTIEERKEETRLMAEALWSKAPSIFESYGGPLVIEHTFSEAPLLFDLGLDGTWDCLTDKHVLIDWKTSRSGWRPGKEKDKMQPLVYARGVEHVTGRPPEGFVFVIVNRKGKIQVLEVDVSPQRVAYLEKLLPPLARMVDNGIFPMNPASSLCNEIYCPWFLRGCPAGPLKGAK